MDRALEQLIGTLNVARLGAAPPGDPEVQFPYHVTASRMRALLPARDAAASASMMYA